MSMWGLELWRWSWDSSSSDAMLMLETHGQNLPPPQIAIFNITLKVPHVLLLGSLLFEFPRLQLSSFHWFVFLSMKNICFAFLFSLIDGITQALGQEGRRRGEDYFPDGKETSLLLDRWNKLLDSSLPLRKRKSILHAENISSSWELLRKEITGAFILRTKKEWAISCRM